MLVLLKQRALFLLLQSVTTGINQIITLLSVSFSHSNMQRERGRGEDQETHSTVFSKVNTVPVTGLPVILRFNIPFGTEN